MAVKSRKWCRLMTVVFGPMSLQQSCSLRAVAVTFDRGRPVSIDLNGVP